MSFVELVPATIEHVEPIARGMRAHDALEARAMGHSPHSALRAGLVSSVHCLTALADGQPIAMLGLVPKSLVEGLGSPWMLGTEEVYRQGRAMLRLGPPMFTLFSDSTPRMEGLVAVENARAIRMLRRWGFDVGEERTMIGGVELVTFSMERS